MGPLGGRTAAERALLWPRRLLIGPVHLTMLRRPFSWQWLMVNFLIIASPVASAAYFAVDSERVPRVLLLPHAPTGGPTSRLATNGVTGRRVLRLVIGAG